MFKTQASQVLIGSYRFSHNAQVNGPRLADLPSGHRQIGLCYCCAVQYLQLIQFKNAELCDKQLRPCERLIAGKVGGICADVIALMTSVPANMPPNAFSRESSYTLHRDVRVNIHPNIWHWQGRTSLLCLRNIWN